jgi:hypothetical protein
MAVMGSCMHMAGHVMQWVRQVVSLEETESQGAASPEHIVEYLLLEDIAVQGLARDLESSIVLDCQIVAQHSVEDHLPCNTAMPHMLQD